MQTVRRMVYRLNLGVIVITYRSPDGRWTVTLN